MHGSPAFIGHIHVKKNTPVFHRAPTYEIEEPFRICVKPKSLIVRLWKTHALVIGLWRQNNTGESEVLLSAVQGHWTKYGTPDYDEVDRKPENERIDISQYE